MNELIKRISHFNPYAIWFVFGLSLLTITSDLVSSSSGFVIMIYMLLVIETLYINYRNKEYIKMTNNVENVFRDNIILLGSSYIIIAVIILITKDSYIIFDSIAFLTTIFGGFVIANDILILGKKEQKFTYLMIDFMSGIAMINLLQFPYYYYFEQGFWIMIPIVLATILFMVLCIKREKIKYNINFKEMIVGLIVMLLQILILTVLTGEIRFSTPMLIFAKLPIILVLLTVNFYLANILWDVNIREMVSSSKHFVIDVLTLTTMLITITYILQSIMSQYYVLELVICIMMGISVLIIRKSRGLDVWI